MWISITSLGLVCGGVLAAQQVGPSTEALLGQARHQDEIEGNVDGAIATYQKVISDPNASRTTVATALLRLGLDYEKIGNESEARTAYERVTRTYPGQTQLVGQAQARLAMLAARTSATQRSGLVTRQVAIDAQCGPSPDDRFMACLKERRPKEDDIVIRNLSTGEERLAYSTGSFVQSLMLSWDGKKIAYVPRGTSDEIHVVGADGTDHHVVYRAPDGVFLLRRFLWSPNGRQIAVTRENADRTFEIALVSTADGSSTRLTSTAWHNVVLGSFSPDGKFLTYAVSSGTASTEIAVIAIDGRQASVLTQGYNDTQPEWTPNGDRIVFISDRAGDEGLWSVRISEGRAQGEPVLLRPNIGQIQSLGFSRNGTFHYRVLPVKYDVFVAGIDPDTLRISVPPAATVDRALGLNRGPAWSPDGSLLAFYRGHPGDIHLVVRSTTTGDERVLPTRLSAGQIAYQSVLNWFPDSRSLLVPDVDFVNQRVTFRRVDADTGRGSVLFEGPYEGTFPLVKLSPDGKWLYRVSVDANERLLKRNVDTGQETELYRATSRPRALCVSSDGLQVAFLNQGSDQKDWRLMTVPTAGGVPREVGRTSDDAFGSKAAWTRDGRFILVALSGGLWAFPTGAGSPRQLDLGLTPGRFLDEVFDLSPDGRQLVFSRIDYGKPEIWAIENLLPASKDGK
jgi:Tol biopolymer transport system component